jgi:hypothetical protein
MKHLHTFESFLNESTTPQLNDLIGKRVAIEIGSGTTTGVFTQDEIKKAISDAIEHNLFDYEFYYNWASKGKEYQDAFRKDTLDVMLKDLSKTLKDLFTFHNGKLVFNMLPPIKEKWIDSWFKKNKSISQSLRTEYYNYREKYAGVKL